MGYNKVSSSCDVKEVDRGSCSQKILPWCYVVVSNLVVSSIDLYWDLFRNRKHQQFEFSTTEHQHQLADQLRARRKLREDKSDKLGSVQQVRYGELKRQNRRSRV